MYTKGEWKVNKFEPNMVLAKVGDSYYGIADCANSGRTAGEELANARLTASAPDLCEALEAIIDAYNKLTEIQTGDLAYAIGGLGIKAIAKAGVTNE